MNTMQLIYHIATHPEYSNVVILDLGDKTPMEAIETLSGSFASDCKWQINGSLEKDVLLVY